MEPEILMSLSWLALDIGLLAYIFTQTKLSLQTVIRQFSFSFLIANIIFYCLFAFALYNAGKNISLLINFKLFIVLSPFSAFFSLAFFISSFLISNFFRKFYQKR